MATFFVISLSNNFYSGFNSQYPSHRISLYHIRKGPSIHLTIKKRNSLRQLCMDLIYTFQSRYHQYLYTNFAGYSIQTNRQNQIFVPPSRVFTRWRDRKPDQAPQKLCEYHGGKFSKLKVRTEGSGWLVAWGEGLYIYIYIYMVGWGFSMRKGFVIGRCLLVVKRNPGSERSHALTPPYILASFC